ncbi:MAG: hypothetical protein HZA91_06480 [Verrucomicrobia bacterium]|nr:hypothetical protein [Verrucomicrobiota bacterium]
MKSAKLFLSVLLLSAATPMFADPRLSLVTSFTAGQFTDAIFLGTPTYSLDALVDTDGHDISGLQYYFTTTPANAVAFDAPPVVALDNPFTSSEIFLAPSTGGTVNQAQGTTIWFKSSPGDYAPFVDNAVARYVFNTASLPGGSYVFTPVAEELTNGSETLNTFAAPRPFRLSVVPEPGTSVLAAVGALLLSSRRRLHRIA